MKNLKKFLLQLLATFLILLIQIPSVFALYSDVPETHTYYEAISTLYSLGRLPVESDNNFHPDDPLTKAELYKLVLTYGMADISQEINLPYSDVPNDSPYASYIQTALDTKILKTPKSTTKFNPNNKVTKSSALTLMFAALGLNGNYFFPKVDFPFTDLTADSDLAPLAFKASQLKILDKKNPKKFLKNKKITKGEAAEYLYRIKQSAQPTLSVTITQSGGVKNNSKDLENNENFATLLDVYSTLNKKFLYKDKLDNDKLLYGAIKGMVEESGDKYTVFDAPAETGSVLSRLSSTYEGIGIVIELIDQKVTVITPFKDSPADKAGIQGQDVITKVDGQSLDGLSLEEVSAKIKGPAKSSVKITVKRGTTEIEFSVIRDSITIKRVTTKTLTSDSGKTVHYIALTDFGEGSAKEFTTAAKELIKKNANGLIVDLRNNPGGYVDEAVDILSLFTSEAKVALKMEYVDKHVEEEKTTADGTLSNYKIVVLINEGSASAAEIIAGALKDYGLATIVGKKSFGKGVAQELRTYKDGSTFKYTISNWLTPNGNSINEKGITPDFVVEKGTDKNVDEQLKAALNQF